jgi:hypothetical protein
MKTCDGICSSGINKIRDVPTNGAMLTFRPTHNDYQTCLSQKFHQNHGNGLADRRRRLQQ